MVTGSISVSVENARKFMMTLVGFQDQFTAKDLISKFRGIISSHVKDYISQIMINGMLSYFMMNAHLMEVSSVVKEKLDAVFENYGVKVQYFNIETIEVPVADYKKVQEAKERKSSRMIENYSWHDERRMLIAEKMASNPGTMGELNSTVSGLMVSSIVGHSIADIAREALDPSKSKHQPGVQNEEPAFGEPISSGGRKCKCGADLPVNANFCFQCGEQVSVDSHTVLCPACSRQVPKGNFCFNCGYRFGNICPNCGSSILEGSKFCMKCGTKL
jgi:membrane protease subunit (stomatin/prohibitin family)